MQRRMGAAELTPQRKPVSMRNALRTPESSMAWKTRTASPPPSRRIACTTIMLGTLALILSAVYYLSFSTVQRRFANAMLTRSIAAASINLHANAEPEPSLCRSVVDLGCYAEALPRAAPRSHPAATGWLARTPYDCACLCSLRLGDRWSGVVSIGATRLGDCGCSEKQGVKYDFHGALANECCVKYDAATTFVWEQPKAREQCASYKGDGGSNEATAPWMARFFRVDLCGACTAAQCPVIYTHTPRSAWEDWTECRREQNPLGDCALPASVRIGSSSSGAESFVDTVREGGTSIAPQAHATCDAALLFPPTEPSSLAFALRQRAPPDVDAHEAQTMVDWSLAWLCAHASLVGLDALKCWVSPLTRKHPEGGDVDRVLIGSEQFCQSSKSYYDCESMWCTEDRSCESNADLQSCACPVPTRCSSTGRWYDCADPECNENAQCLGGGVPGEKQACACPARLDDKTSTR